MSWGMGTARENGLETFIEGTDKGIAYESNPDDFI